MYKVIEDLRVLNPISKKFNLDFCKQYKYYNGDSNSNNKGECLPLKFKHKDKIYNLIPNTSIYNLGRATHNQIFVEDFHSVFISRNHATLECIHSLNAWFIRDGQWDNKAKCWRLSTNGTYINSTKVDKNGMKLKNGDIITVGDTTISVEIGNK
jgi:hypothetical protein